MDEDKIREFDELLRSRPKVPRLCVFCGEPPESNSPEHVIPQWLIRLTGDPKRSISVPRFEHDRGKILAMPFDQFVFPACHACNSAYSDLEGAASRCMPSMLAGEPLAASDFVTLLQWFDKVRLGCWSAARYHTQGLWPLSQNYSISQYIGGTDRGLIMFRLRDAPPGINFIGANSPIFQWTPCCLGVRINDLLVICLAHQWLVAKSLGFPFPAKMLYVGGMTMLDIRSGRERVTSPVLPVLFRRDGVGIWQAIWPDDAVRMDHYQTAYVKDHQDTPKASVPFLESNGSRARPYPPTGSNSWLPGKGAQFHWDSMEDVIRSVLALQWRLWEIHAPEIAPDDFWAKETLRVRTAMARGFLKTMGLPSL